MSLRLPGTPDRIERGALDRPGDPRAQTLRVACTACNTGWMKRIQEEAVATLTDFGSGNWPELTDDSARHLANWATLFSMTYEFADRRTMATPPEERKFLMENSEPPPNWIVWAASYSGIGIWNDMVNHKGGFVHSGPIDLTAARSPPMNLQVTVLTFGQLLISTFSSRVDTGLDMREYASSLGLQTIWPFEGSIIKPARPHTDQEVEAVAHAIEWALA